MKLTERITAAKRAFADPQTVNRKSEIVSIPVYVEYSGKEIPEPFKQWYEMDEQLRQQRAAKAIRTETERG